jgi:hypothetical protein
MENSQTPPPPWNSNGRPLTLSHGTVVGEGPTPKAFAFS